MRRPFVIALGQPKAWAWSNGDSANRVCDADARTTQNEFAAYGFDAASRIASITQQLWANSSTSPAGPLRQAVTWRIDYDNRNRITDLQRSAPGAIAADMRVCSAVCSGFRPTGLPARF